MAVTTEAKVATIRSAGGASPTRWMRSGGLVAESYEPGASVSRVARRHQINANLLFTWRRHMRPSSPAEPPMELIPVDIVGGTPAGSPRAAVEIEQRGAIEITLASGVRVRVDASVSEAALKRVLSALKAAT
jgi:transposase